MTDDQNDQVLTDEQAADLEALRMGATGTGTDRAPPSATQAPPAERIPTDELIRPILAMMCAGIAPAWGISDDEQAQLAKAYGAVVDKYFPDGIEFGPEVTAIIITAGVVVPRLGRPLKEIPPDPVIDAAA